VGSNGGAAVQSHALPQVRKYGAGSGKSLASAKDGAKDIRAFYAIRKDGSAEDFSYLKCLASMYPGEIAPPADAKRARKD
jgi:hypothetical protein